MSHFWRLICLSALTVAVAASSGCVANIGPGGAAPGLIYSDVTYPNALNPNMSYRIEFDRDDIEILGPVESEASSRWYFFVVSSGNSGYADLMKAAREVGGDGVMNVTLDTQYSNWFLFYAKITVKLQGLAYRYKRLPSDGLPASALKPQVGG